MLAGLFYTVEDLKQSPGAITATILFNAAHSIFKGHFPGIPVVPGVCMMQLVKEILEDAIGTKTRLIKANQLKFLTVIVPNDTPQVNLKMHYTNSGDLFDVQAELLNSAHSFFKFRGSLRALENF
jgi:3-hydroxyacyl-[acyl-carrier-protein] dehydratase